MQIYSMRSAAYPEEPPTVCYYDRDACVRDHALNRQWVYAPEEGLSLSTDLANSALLMEELV